MLREVSRARPWLIGVDDTDTAASRGTGYHARRLLTALVQENLADALGITRHRLLTDGRIPYTTHNSSACLQISSATPVAALMTFCREFFLADASADGNVGVCLATPSQGQAVTAYSRKAKHEVVDRDAALAAARGAGIALDGLSGTFAGVVGALAGVGLYADGNDGYYAWKAGLDSLAGEVTSIATLLEATTIDDVRLKDGASVAQHGSASLVLPESPLLVRLRGLSVLLVQHAAAEDEADYVCADNQGVIDFRR